jgi:hypothetical protein
LCRRTASIFIFLAVAIDPRQTMAGRKRAHLRATARPRATIGPHLKITAGHRARLNRVNDITCRRSKIGSKGIVAHLRATARPQATIAQGGGNKLFVAPHHPPPMHIGERAHRRPSPREIGWLFVLKAKQKSSPKTFKKRHSFNYFILITI